ncbi:MAG: hypothetical protein GYB24_09630 [Rhodobacteraceae bacterium]|nr:hypothetical protein [Paracoccaceae bacterium]
MLTDQMIHLPDDQGLRPLKQPDKMLSRAQEKAPDPTVSAPVPNIFLKRFYLFESKAGMQPTSEKNL